MRSSGRNTAALTPQKPAQNRVLNPQQPPSHHRCLHLPKPIRCPDPPLQSPPVLLFSFPFVPLPVGSLAMVVHIQPVHFPQRMFLLHLRSHCLPVLASCGLQTGILTGSYKHLPPFARHVSALHEPSGSYYTVLFRSRSLLLLDHLPLPVYLHWPSPSLFPLRQPFSCDFRTCTRSPSLICHDYPNAVAAHAGIKAGSPLTLPYTILQIRSRYRRRSCRRHPKHYTQSCPRRLRRRVIWRAMKFERRLSG